MKEPSSKRTPRVRVAVAPVVLDSTFTCPDKTWEWIYLRAKIGIKEEVPFYRISATIYEVDLG
jgi:hypothetical protein